LKSISHQKISTITGIKRLISKKISDVRLPAMKTIITALLFCLVITAISQNTTSALQTMIDTENNFARLSKEKTTREAFLEYLSDSTVLTDKGTLIKGKSSWENRPGNNTLLFWWPVFAGISASGDLGFSTGPWQWAPSKTDKPQAYGYYATVWKKSADGTWKMAIDLGIQMPEAPSESKTVRASNPKAQRKINAADRVRTFHEINRTYIEKLNNDSLSFDKKYFTDDALLERKGSTPEYFPFSKSKVSGWKTQFSQSGFGLSEARDLGYSYGTVKIYAADKTRSICFLRVWKLEGNVWKIVLDVVGGNE
jgi:hypothetical protein